MKIYFILLLLFAISTTSYSHKIPNGYYNSVNSGTYVYIYNDTIILPYHSGVISVSILKGVIDNKKWINFIPVKNKIESRYEIVTQEKNDSVSILRFNLCSSNGEIVSNAYDGRYGKRVAHLYEFGAGLGCKLAYTTPQNVLIKKDTFLIFNGKYFEITLPSSNFVNANLTIEGGKYVTVPILKDSLIYINVVQAPFVFYNDKWKRMKYRYSEQEHSIEILFNFPFNKEWNKYIKTDKPYDIRDKWAVEKCISDMKYK